MNDYKVTDTELTSVANAIRIKGGTSASLPWPDGFVSAISDISSGGIIPSGSIPISANGTYDVTSFANAVVNVPTGGTDENYLIAINAMSGSIYDGNLSEVPNSAFYSRSQLLGVEMPACTSIGSSAFYGCRSLSTVSFPDCTNIGNNAFYGCSSLATVSFPDCTNIGNNAFFNCFLLSTVSFPACTDIGASAFYGCSLLATVSFPEIITLPVSTFRSTKIVNCYLDRCTTIEKDAFYDVTTLKTIDAPMVQEISGSAVFFNTRISQASFPLLQSTTNATTNYGVFASNPSLLCAYFEEINHIGGRTFYNCSSLMSVYILSNAVATLDNSTAFQNTPIQNSTYTGTFGSIYVPASLVDAYKSATNWSVYSDRITAYTE